MKKISYLLLAIVFLTSCSEDDPIPEVITDAEAAEEVASSLATDVLSIAEDMGSTGYRSQQNATNGRVANIPGCGETVTQEISKSYDGDFISGTFDSDYEVSLECFLNFPVSLTSSFTTSTNTESARFATEGSSNGTSNVTIDQENLGNYLFNSAFVKTNVFTQKTEDQKSFNSTYTVTTTDISINTAFIASLLTGQVPTGNLIASGTASYQVVGVNQNNIPFEYSASVTFVGDGTAEVTINGNTYIVDLTTGEILD